MFHTFLQLPLHLKKIYFKEMQERIQNLVAEKLEVEKSLDDRLVDLTDMKKQEKV